MEPLGWDEIVSQPGMGGYLSFLNGPVPLPHLQQSNPGVDQAPEPSAAAPVLESTPDAVPVVAHEKTPELPSSAATIADPGLIKDPVVISAPVLPPTPRIRIRHCKNAQDGHSLGEEVLYQSLWKTSRPESPETRTITIGWRGMSQLCRMTPKNCKINTQRLIRKLALEVLSPYNTPESIGTTYRVYSSDEILRRRRAQGLEWVVRSRGVEFVDPATGLSRTASFK
jgi:hypothetical protein